MGFFFSPPPQWSPSGDVVPPQGCSKGRRHLMMAAKGAHRLQHHHTEIKGKASVGQGKEPTDPSPRPRSLSVAPRRRTRGGCKLQAHSRDWAPEDRNTGVRGPRNHRAGNKEENPKERVSNSKGLPEQWPHVKVAPRAEIRRPPTRRG